MRLGPSAAVTESIPASILDGLTLEAVEWLPSGADTGLLRVRGRWAVGVAHPLGLPVLCAAVGGAVSRVDSLPDAPSTRTNGSVWRGAYLVPEAVARAGLWLEWASGERSALPMPAGLDERVAAGVLEPEPAEPEPGGEVIDRAVLAERRARRAEAAGQAQARVASEALRALDALELRGTELEQRVEALAAERDALAEQARALEQAAPRDEHQRRALVGRPGRRGGRAPPDARVAAADARGRGRAHERRRAPARARGARGVGAAAARRARRAGRGARGRAGPGGRAGRGGRCAPASRRSPRPPTSTSCAATSAAGSRLSDRAAAEWEGRASEAEAALELARGELSARDAELTSARAELEQVRAQIGRALGRPRGRARGAGRGRRGGRDRAQRGRDGRRGAASGERRPGGARGRARTRARGPQRAERRARRRDRRPRLPAPGAQRRAHGPGRRAGRARSGAGGAAAEREADQEALAALARRAWRRSSARWPPPSRS